jgi:transcriptional regulator with XRE-family HTH domain
MANELFELLGINPDEPRVRRATRDARDVERLIDTLVDLRCRLGVSQAELAREMDTTQSTVSKFERAGGDPRVSTLQRYASAIGAHVRFSVDASGCRAPTWQANYELPAPVEPDPDETESDADISIPVIRRAS